jgi:hypothetical protein
MQSNETRYFEMTQRSILAGVTPTVIIKAGANVTVKGTNGGLVTAESESRWGLKVEKHSEAEFARARAAIGEKVLFDLRFKKPGAEETPEDVIEVQLGASGEVSVPFDAKLKIYAGKNIDVQGIRGQVDAYSGFKLSMKDVYCLGNASAGGTMSLDCETMLGENVEFKSGSDLRFYIHDLTSAHIRVKDLGGFWEAKIGSGEKSVYLKCGGDATLVTDQQVDPLPPHYVFGKIERPALE